MSTWEEHQQRLKLPTFRGHRPYAPNWNNICYHVRRATGNRCVNCWRRCALVHHLFYATQREMNFAQKLLSWFTPDSPKRWQKIYGWEQGGISVVPLCTTCHALVHQSICWHKHPSDPDLDCNYPETIEYLRNCYWELEQLVRLGRISPIPGREMAVRR